MRLNIVLPLVLVLVGAVGWSGVVEARACVCPAVYVILVCGANGRTYGSSCEAKCAGVRVRYDGPCKGRGRKRGRRFIDLLD